jgi:HEAT repeat protein
LVANDDDEVRMAAIGAMERIGSQANLAVPALIAALEDPNPELRFAAADALKRYSNRASWVVPILIEALRDPEPAVVFAAANALSRMGILAVVTLSAMLDDKNPYIRAVVVGALGGVGLLAQPALGDILPLVDDRNEMVRAAAVRAIGHIASEHETEIRVNRGLEFRLAPDVVKWMADREAQMRQTTKSVALAAMPQLTDALRDPYEDVRFAAATALRIIGAVAAESAPNLIDAIEPNRSHSISRLHHRP